MQNKEIQVRTAIAEKRNVDVVANRQQPQRVPKDSRQEIVGVYKRCTQATQFNFNIC